MCMPTPNRRQTYIPLSSYKGYDDFLRKLSDEYMGTSDITLMHRGLATTFPTSHPMATEAVGQMATEVQSIPLTVIAGLEASIPDITSRKSLEIHFVAAADREISTRGMLEEILHQFPSLKRFHIRYIGPESVGDQNLNPNTNHACADCKGRGCTRTWSLHPMEYHRFLEENPTKRPDFIVGINTGWSEIAVDSWSVTLDKILALKVPTLFTAYSELEGRLEAAQLRYKRVNFIVDAEENRWKGVIPIINKGILASQGVLAVYSNDYWYIFKGR